MFLVPISPKKGRFKNKRRPFERSEAVKRKVGSHLLPTFWPLPTASFPQSTGLKGTKNTPSKHFLRSDKPPISPLVVAKSRDFNTCFTFRKPKK